MAVSEELKTDVVVIGAGPGGYPAAFAAADAGLDVMLVNAEARPGGVCANRGCIPSKTLLHLAKLLNETAEASEWGVSFGKPQVDLARIREWKSSVVESLTGGILELCRARGIEYVAARASFVDSNQLELARLDGSTAQLRFRKAIVATGSRPAMPKVFDIGDERVMDSTGALELQDVPKRLLIVGGGYIGLEMGTVYTALGSEVTVVEMTPGLLPGADRDLVRPLKKRLEASFAAIHVKTKVAALEATAEGIVATLEGEGVEPLQTFDRVLVCVGRVPNSEGLSLERTQVRVDKGGFVVADGRRQTDDPNILVIGDVAGEPMLAHKATHDARIAVATLRGEAVAEEDPVIPAVVFTDPELAWCGLTESEARAERRKVKTVRFPWAASGRAQTLGRTEGLTKLICDPADGRILGVGIVGAGAGELIAEGVLALARGASAEELAHCIHAHPTLSETLMESAEAVVGQGTHIYRARR